MLEKTIKEIKEEINRLGFLLIGCTDENEHKNIKKQIKERKANLKALQAQSST